MLSDPGGRLTQTKWTQLSLATFLLFLDGSFFSISVFNEAVEKTSVIPGALDDVWSSSMALMGLAAIPFAFYTGYLIGDGVVPSGTASLPFGKSKTDRVRIVSVFCSTCILTMFLAGTGIKNNIPSWITFAVAMQGVPFSVCKYTGRQRFEQATSMNNCRLTEFPSLLERPH